MPLRPLETLGRGVEEGLVRGRGRGRVRVRTQSLPARVTHNATRPSVRGTGRQAYCIHSIDRQHTTNNQFSILLSKIPCPSSQNTYALERTEGQGKSDL